MSGLPLLSSVARDVLSVQYGDYMTDTTAKEVLVARRDSQGGRYGTLKFSWEKSGGFTIYHSIVCYRTVSK